MMLSFIVHFFCFVQMLFVHFLLAQKTNQKRAASDLFWDYHFLGCPRITTRRLRQMAEPPQTVMLTFKPSLRSLQKCKSISQKDLKAFEIQEQIIIKLLSTCKLELHPLSHGAKANRNRAHIKAHISNPD
jgi:hypothetical protein